MTKEKRNDSLSLADYGKANALLALSKVIMVGLTQPLQVVMRHQQKSLVLDNPKVLSAVQSFKEIKTNQPFSSLFRGAGPGALKEFSKNLLYKGALITGAPHLAESILPNTLANYTSPTQYNLIKAVTAGIIASSSDAILGGVLESWATYRATSHGVHANNSFFGEANQEKTFFGKIGKLYKGFIPTAIKGSVAFSTMFALTAPIKTTTNNFYGLSPMDATPWYALGTSAILCGVAVALTSSPFDIIKTQAQMPGGKNTGTYRALMNNYKLHGIRGVTAGLPIKTAMVSLGWSLNFFATQYIADQKEHPPVAPHPVDKKNNLELNEDYRQLVPVSN